MTSRGTDQIRNSADGMALAALSKWANCSTTLNDRNTAVTVEELRNIITGPDIDSNAGDLLSKALKVKLILPSGSVSSSSTVCTYDAYLSDVPGDGNCGFYAVAMAALPLGGKTATGLELPRTVMETRRNMVQFLRTNRGIIEKSLVRRLRETSARHALWSDLLNSTCNVERPSFDVLCSSLLKEGIRGHWLGSMLGEIEVHLLARSLGVIAFCVRAGVNADKELYLRQEGAPFTFLWEEELSGAPNGAVVIRFVGPFCGGHFQIVRCGTYVDFTDSTPANITNPIFSEEASKKLERDVEMVQRMHGVQHATKGYDEKSANSTGKVLLAAVSRWYKEHGHHFSNQQTCTVSGNAVFGPPWKAEQVLEFKDVLLKRQAKARTIPIKRAYQLTHDDIAMAMREYVAKQLGDALASPGTNPNVDWSKLQTTLMVIASFGFGCRGAEMVSIRIGDLRFFGNSVDTTIGAVLYGVKSKKGSQAIRKVLFPSWSDTFIISPSHAVLIQLALVHGIHSGAENKEGIADQPLFPSILNNQPQMGQFMSSDTYSAGVKDIFRSLGVSNNATEHSPRRGSYGFRYYVLNENLDYIRDFLGHANIKETLTYVGFFDKNNSYICQGYGTSGSAALR